MSAAVRRFVKSRPILHRFAAGTRAAAIGVGALVAGHRGARDHVLSSLSFLAGSDRILGRPTVVTIEPGNTCSLACPVCETGAGVLRRAPRLLSLDDFRTIVDRVAAHVHTLHLYFMGEPFLNRDFHEMVRYAKDRGIPWVTTCTNGEQADPERLVACGLDEVAFQVGGMTQETHAVYRVKGRLVASLAALRETVRLKRERGARLRVTCGFIVMRQNEHEVPLFERTMKEIGVDEASIVKPCVRDCEQARRFLPSDPAYCDYDRAALERGELRPAVPVVRACPWIHFSIAVHANGDVVPCCRDAQGDEVMGNLLAEDLDAIWNGPRFRDFRRRLRTASDAPALCRLCSGFGVPSPR